MSRKKFRELKIEDENWAWIFYAKGDYYDHQILKIWKDKKIVLEKTFGYCSGRRKNYKITPGLITRFIKRYLKK
jgi:hypothetical protein